MAIRITTQPSADDLFGKSHWWGSPDLPEGVDYPCSDDLGADENGEEATLLFICQIRLEDIAEYDTEGRLPHKGMLYFFADIDYFLGRDDADCEGLGQWPEECNTVRYTIEFRPPQAKDPRLVYVIYAVSNYADLAINAVPLLRK